MKRTGFTIVMLALSIGLAAQNYQLTAEQQQSIETEAKKKVETFQENCRIVGNTGKTYDEKTCIGGIIDVALEDFMGNAKIQITNFDGSVQKPKTIRRYLLNLALLARDRYREIDISSYDCAMASDFVPDPNREGWYVGEVKIFQRFSAVTKEFRRVEDVVERTTKVYAKRNKFYTGRGWTVFWTVLLGDISAKTIE